MKNVVLITGGTRGIGLACVNKFINEGWIVIFCARNKTKIDEIIIEFNKKENFDIFGIDVNLKSKDDVKKLLDFVKSKTNKLHALINNVGGLNLDFGGLEDLKEESWISAYELNFLSTVRLSKEALPLLRAANSSSIINLSSLAGKRPGKFNPHYGAAKAAVIHFSKYLSFYLAKDNIRVNSLCPSSLDDETLKDDIIDRAKRQNLTLLEADTIMRTEVLDRCPLKKIGTPAYIADLIYFLCSDSASTITGSCFTIDSGQSTSLF
jgi:NAD(P)-dependent dehydrogenase (short-subunit alcohol dehydrogenase family)